ncbi:MAG: M28 family peptidase, partial [Desulfurococcales archaeon]|nr:M28 family peptidase [Desulfurococcales archaeon]
MRRADAGEALRSLVSRLYTGEQHIAGDRGERGEAERIAGVLEEALGSTVDLVETPTLSWRPGPVEVHPEPPFSAALPYTLDSDVEARAYPVQGDASHPVAWRRFPEGRIAVASEPPDPDDIEAVALLASESGASALLVESPLPRIIVTKGAWGYSHSSGAPTPIPVIVVPRGYYSMLGPGREVSVKTSASLEESVSYTLSLDIGGREPQVVVGAHFDRWFTGFQDDILGVAQAAVAASILSDLGYSVRLLVFSSEEHGAPGPAGWYWAWGSRFYAGQLVSSGLNCSFRVYVNFDVAGSGKLLISGSPQYVGLSGFKERCCECPECDSFQLASAGVPTISIHSLWTEEIKELYHTPRDTPEAHDPGQAVAAVMESVRLVREGPRWEAFSARLASWLGRGPLLARRAYYVLEALSRRVGWETLYCEAARRFLKAVHYGSYRLEDSHLEAQWFPEVVAYKRLLGDARRGRAPREVW